MRRVTLAGAVVPLAALAAFGLGEPLGVIDPTADATDPVVVAAGDIACAPGQTVTPVACHHAHTAAMLDGADKVLTLGDNQYGSGLLVEFLGSYDPTWGQHKHLTAPVPGNHEYRTKNGGAGYFDYFGSLAGTRGEGWYSYDVGTWHLIALNSVLPMKQGSPQNMWLEADLKANPAACTLAYWHYPLYAAGEYTPGLAKSRPVWADLLRARADVVLAGHEHHYERWAQMDQWRRPTASGIRSFVVGNGGKDLGPVTPPADGLLEAYDDVHFGVLRLTLHPDSYDWAFTGEDGTVLDSGTAACVR